MTNLNSLYTIDSSKALLTFNQYIMERAKFYWNWAKWCQVIILLFGLATILTNQAPLLLSALAFLLTISSALLKYHSDELKDQSQELFRMYEFWDGLDEAMQAYELRDLEITIPKKLNRRLVASSQIENYFSSKEKPGTKRLLDNLEESSWWTWQVAYSTTIFYVLISSIVALLAIVLLLLAFQMQPSQLQTEAYTRAFLSALAFVFTGGYVRNAAEFWRLQEKARLTTQKARQLKHNSQIEKVRAIKLLHNYQINRAISPLIPTFI